MASKYLSLPVLKKKLFRLRQQRKKIVFTNGCFDLLHGGHIEVFKKAKSLGDVLVLGINTDASVKRLKGAKRPILRLPERAKILSALEYIDFVVAFGEDTPAKLVKAIRPDVLVKGGDYLREEIVGRDDAKKVVRVNLVKGKSTTGIIQRILKAYGR